MMNQEASSARQKFEVKSKRCCDGINKTLHILANEPSLGLYRVQEHVRKTMPKLSNCVDRMETSDQQLHGLVYDTQFAIQTVKEIEKSEQTFENIEHLLKKATSSSALINMKFHPPLDLIKFN